MNLDGSIGSLAVVDHQVPQCSKQSDFQPEVQDDVHWSISAPTALQDISNDQLRHSQLDSDLHQLAQCSSQSDVHSDTGRKVVSTQLETTVLQETSNDQLQLHSTPRTINSPPDLSSFNQTEIDFHNSPASLTVHDNSPEKLNDMLSDMELNKTITGTKRWTEILTHTNAVGIKEADMYLCFMEYLKTIYANRCKFMTLLLDVFGFDRMTDSSFIYFLSFQLDLNFHNLKRGISRWIDAGMQDPRGRNRALSSEARQQIYDAWLDHAQPSTDNRNGRCRVKISKMEYLKKYSGIENKDVVIEEQVNKRGCVNYLSNRMIFTSTIRGIKQKLDEKNINVSTGSILNLKPFFITYASEKEMLLCLCKICLNVKFMFDPLMVRAKKDGDEVFDSISSFFMHGCTCDKSPNGYYMCSCSSRRCKNCMDSKPAPLKCQSSNEIVSYDQFEVVEREYLQLDKKTNEVEKKNTKLTDRVTTQTTYTDLYKKLVAMRKVYTIHKYHIMTFSTGPR